ncbi:MAG: hypothetical protein IJ512_00865 [Ruminococcus sp.]|nr:hypothetical protein [Ruminococcus sp.]
MKLVQSLNEIKANIKVLDDYLNSNDEEKISYAKDRLKRGTCFIAVQNEDGFYFYPSRFIGYANNSMDKHDRNSDKDGKETNPAISSIIGSKPKFNDELEEIYKDYCESLGFTANKAGAFGVQRKYWILSE